MNKACIRKSVLSTLFSRGWLICLLFLLSGVTNLQAQTYLHYGEVGLPVPFETPNHTATLNILDDDNSNDSSDPGYQRRTIVPVFVENGNEAGTTTSAKFKVAFKNGADGIFCCGSTSVATTASKDIEVTFQVINGTATQGTSCTPGVDFTVPATFTKIITAGNNASDVIEFPVCQDNIIEGTENFTVKITGTRVLGGDILSVDGVNPVIFDYDRNPLTLDILDYVDPADKQITLRISNPIAPVALDRNSTPATIVAEFTNPLVTCTTGDLVINLLPGSYTGGLTVADYSLGGSTTITIPRGQSSSTTNVSLSAQCNSGVAASHTTSMSMNVGGTLSGWTVNPTSTVTINPTGIDNTITPAADAAICAGSSVTLAVPALTGATYQWYEGVGVGTIIVGETSRTYVASTAGRYKVVITNSFGCSRTSADRVVAVNPLPLEARISTLSPSAICGDANAQITINSTPDVSSFSKQWYMNGSPLSGQTSESLTVNRSSFGIVAGTTYTFKVETKNTTTGCVSMSNGIDFTFGSGTAPDAPQIAPNSATICTGGPSGAAVLTATSTGAAYPANAVYNWYKDGNTTPVATITGSNVYSVPASQAGSYTVIVYIAGCASSASNTATVSPGSGTAPAAPVVSPSGSVSFCAGGSTTLTIDNPDAGATYQWYRGAGSTAPGAIPALAGTGLTFAANEATTYWVVASKGGCTSVNSNVVSATTSGATPLPAPVVNNGAINVSFCAGGSFELTVTNAAALSGATYQWHSLAGGVLAGQTGTSLNLSPTTTQTYWVVASKDGCQVQASNYVTVTPSGSTSLSKPTITVLGTLCAGGSVQLTAAATNTTGVIGYRWFKDGYFVIQTPTNVYNATDPGNYTVKTTTGTCSSSESSSVLVSPSGTTAPDAPSIAAVGGITTGCAGGTVSLYVANPVAGLHYQWYNSVDNGPITPNGDGQSHAASKTASYWVVASDGTCSSVSSNSIPVSLSGGASVTTPNIAPVTGTFCEGGSKTLSVTNVSSYTGTNVSYQWHRVDGGIIDGEIGASIAANEEDSYWVVVIEDGCQSNPSNRAALTKSGTGSPDAPVVEYEDGSTFCAGGSVALTIANASSYPAGTTFQWNRNKIGEILGANESTYHATVADTYWAVAKNGTCQSEASSQRLPVTESGSTNIAQPKIQTSGGVTTICTGGSIDLKAVQNVVGEPDYPAATVFKWYKSGEHMIGKTASLITVTEDGNYTVVALDSPCESVVSAGKSITVSGGPAPAPTTLSPATGTICSGGSVTLTAAAVSGATYQWYKDGAPLGTPTGNTTYDATTSGKYTVVVIAAGGCRSVHSNIADIGTGTGSASELPKIIKVTGNNTICINGSSELKAVKNSDGTSYDPLTTTFKWFKNDAEITLPGWTGSTVHPTAGGSYTVKVIQAGACGESAMSASADLIMGATTNLAQPAINTPGGVTEICGPGGSIKLTAVNSVSGTAYTESGLKYRWFDANGFIVQTDANVYFALAGGDYYVKVTDGTCSSIPSAVTPIRMGTDTNVPAKPTIEAVDGITAICVGGTTTLRVTNPDSRYSYQWYGETQGEISGAVGVSYPAGAADYYYVVASYSGCTSETSSRIQVTLSGSTTNLRQPILNSTPVTFCRGGSTTITIDNPSTDYPATTTFQWNGRVQGVIDGQTGSSLVVTVPDTYWVVARDGGCQSIKSNEKPVTEGAATNLYQPTIDTQGSVREFCTGGSLTISITNLNRFTNGETFQWYNSHGMIAGETLPTYFATEEDSYYVVAKDGGCQSKPSGLVTLTKIPTTNTLAKPVISSTPTPAVLCIGGSVRLEVKPMGGGTYPNSVSYTWYLNGVVIPGATGAVYAAPNTGDYQVTVGGTCQALPSNILTVTPGASPAPAQPGITPNNASFCNGGSAVLTAVPREPAAVSDSYTYEWFLDGSSIPGATGVSYAATASGQYTVVAIAPGGCRSVYSDPATVSAGSGTALAQPTIIAVQGAFTVCSGGSLELQAQSTGAAYNPLTTTYMWYKNGSHVAGVTGPVLHAADENASYYVIVTDGCPSVQSAVVNVTVSGTTPFAQPIITVDPATNTICQNGSVKLTATPSSGAPYVGVIYRWFKNGSFAAQTNTNIYHPLWVAGDVYPVTYTVKVVGSPCESKVSAGVDINQSANTAPAQPTITPSSQQICMNGMVSLTLSGSNGTSYEWYRNGVMVATTTEKAYNTIQDGHYYAIVVDGTCRSKPSGEVEIVFSASTAPNKPSLSGATTICTNGSVLLTATPAGAVSGYIWYRNGVQVATTTPSTAVNYLALLAGTYTVAATDGGTCISKESNPITIVDGGGEAAFKPRISSASTELCAGLDLMLTATTATTSGITGYTWIKDDVVVATTSTNTYKATQIGKYAVVVNTSGCTSQASDVVEITASTDPNCIASRIRLSVDAAEVTEGNATTVRATLLDGYVAKTGMTINLSFTGTAEKGACVSGNGHNDFDILTAITILANGTQGTTSLSTCWDHVYEGDETVIIAATYNSTAILDSPKTVIIKDKDADADGKLSVKWELLPTGSAAGTYAVFKGQTATYKATAVDPVGNPISVQNAHTVTLTYAGSTAASGTNYAPIANAIIPAGASSVNAVMTTVDDHMAEPDLHVISNIVSTAMHSVISANQDLTIKSACSNGTGGVDVKVELTPATVVEGSPFTLTVSIDGTSCLAGEDVVLNLAERAGSIAKKGVDYNMPATITIPRGSGSASISIATVDNNLYDGSRRMDIDVTPVNAKNVVTMVVPSPLSGIIQDNDKPCITITSDKKGIDDEESVAEITVAVHNMTKTAPAIVLQLANVGTATHYTSTMPATITLTALTPTDSVKKFTVTSQLVVPSHNRRTFKKDQYATTYEEIILNIGAINVVGGASCFEPLKVINSDDFDRDGLPNWYEREDPGSPGSPSYLCTGDTNHNGIPNEWDPYDPNADDDGDGIPNWKEDTNGDGDPYNDFAVATNCLPNFANPDSDNDGVPDSVEKWTDRVTDNNEGDIRIHPALSFNDDGIGNDFLYIENITKYPNNEVTVFDRQGIVVYQTKGYDNTNKAFRGIPNKGRVTKKIAMGTYFVVVEYTNDKGEKKRYSKAVEVRY